MTYSLAVPQWSTAANSGLARATGGLLVQPGGETIGPFLAAQRQWLDLSGDGGVISARTSSLPWSDSWATQPIGILGVQLEHSVKTFITGGFGSI